MTITVVRVFHASSQFEFPLFMAVQHRQILPRFLKLLALVWHCLVVLLISLYWLTCPPKHCNERVLTPQHYVSRQRPTRLPRHPIRLLFVYNALNTLFSLIIVPQSTLRSVSSFLASRKTCMIWPALRPTSCRSPRSLSSFYRFAHISDQADPFVLRCGPATIPFTDVSSYSCPRISQIFLFEVPS
jgi:hypothetical protein